MASKPNPSNNTQNVTTEQRFHALALATSDVVYRLSADWEVMQELDGRGFLHDANQPVVGWKEINVFAGDMDLVNEAIQIAIEHKAIFALEHRVNQANGSVGWTFSKAVPIKDDQGEILEWLGTASDITARKEAELALQESRKLAMEQKRNYETITSGTPDLMYLFDLNYRFTYANEALLAMWGKTAEESIGKSLLENGYEPWHATMHEREIDQVVRTRKPIRGEVSFQHAEFGRRIYDYIFTPVFNSDGQVEGIAGTTRDVTDLKNIQENLQNTSEELQSTVEELAASNEELLSTNEQLQSLNQQLQEARQQILSSELILRQAIDAASFGTWYIHPETRKFVTDARVKQLLGFFQHEEPTLDDALARVVEEQRPMITRLLENAMYNNGDYDVTCSVIGLHDNKFRWVRAVGNLKANDDGSFSIFTGLLMDITEQKNDELRKNDFIAMVSHELKTPLTSMKAYVQVVLLKLKSSQDELLKGALVKANLQVEKMTAMINGFLNLSRLESGKINIQHERFDLADLMRTVREETEATISSHQIIFAPVESAKINGDQEKIAHVVHNFISNAVKYSPAGSLINVACTSDHQIAQISVKDRGMGISKQDLNKVFDRYFRADDSMLNTIAGFGIGLYICKEIITRHGGQIWAESEQGKGSVFSFTIPMP
ncbi:ATP-binding protein [Pedobacter sp. AW1-32]|uniref:PAS domain-containing sensor histidine kinase n=1 Tax=Pedobacter sp. AW1-32 TaxID=3383026 RepID=UPI003FF0A1C4